MALNSPQLALPDAAETTAFRTVDRILRTDPVLSRLVRTWVSWRGEDVDFLGPTFATCPFLQIAPQPNPTGWETEGQHKTPLTVGIQLAVAGTDVDQLLNFWGAVRSALWPAPVAGDRFNLVRTWFAESKISRPMLIQSAVGIHPEETDGARLLIAEGQLLLSLLIDTP